MSVSSSSKHDPARPRQWARHSPITNKTNLPSLKRYRMVPIGTMKQLSLVRIDSRNSGPLPGVKNARSVDEDVACRRKSGFCNEIFNLNLPLPRCIMPICTCYLMVQFDKLVEFVLFCK